MQKKISIKSRLIVLIVICCLFPMISIIAFNFYYMNSHHFENKIEQQIMQLKYSDDTTIERLQYIIQLSRELSYDHVVEKEYQKYKSNQIPARKLLVSTTYYLNEKYSRKESIKAAMLWYDENPKELQCNTYNVSVDGGYGDIQTYWDKDHERILKYAEKLNTEPEFYIADGRFYLIRNIYDSDYKKIAVLVLLLNKSYCLERYDTYQDGVSFTLCLNDSKLQLSGNPVTAKETGSLDMGGKSGYIWENDTLYMYHDMQRYGVHLKSYVRFDNSTAFTPFYGYRGLLLGMVICLIFILVMLTHIFTKHVAEPMQHILSGAENIKKGKLGFQIDYEPQNAEFKYLTDAFNHMSGTLKQVFDHMYEEELTLRDAKIVALQSRLNPHFMNNTLEIINWEARLSGDEKVSKMIEALSTLMDAGIDRNHEPEVTFEQELVYVEAFLYIVSQRFGDRLEVIKEFPDEIMEYKVPRLIVQPLLENAVEYGAGFRHFGKRKIKIRGYCEGEYLYIEIINQGVLDQESKNKIEQLLEGIYDQTSENSGSMGIVNVHQRLKILYGEPCGLKIYQLDEENVCAEMIIFIGNERNTD